MTTTHKLPPLSSDVAGGFDDGFDAGLTTLLVGVRLRNLKRVVVASFATGLSRVVVSCLTPAVSGVLPRVSGTLALVDVSAFIAFLTEVDP